jgi:membrane protein involved in colicin uptake
VADQTEAKTFTQEQLDEIIEKRLAREREKYADYDKLQEQVAALTADKAKADAERKKAEDEGKSVNEKVAEKVAELQKQLEAEAEARQKSESEALRLRVAAAKGLTEAQARRLQGSTKEELEADADDLLETFGGKKDDKPEEKGFGRPRESLRPGASSEDDDADLSRDDATKVADKILESNRI